MVLWIRSTSSLRDNAAVCVVLASEGYPVKYEKGFPISGLDEFKKHEGYYCFHAGTKFDGDQIVTNGGRVLGVTAKGKDLKEARKNAYAATEWVRFTQRSTVTISEKPSMRLKSGFVCGCMIDGTSENRGVF